MNATGRLLVVLGVVCLAGGAAWLSLRDDDRPAAPRASTSAAELLADSQDQLQTQVQVTDEVIEDELLEEDVAGATVIGDDDHPLLVIVRDAQELPALIDGMRVRVEGELQELEVAARDGLLAAGPVMERFRNEPFVFADSVEIVEE